MIKKTHKNRFLAIAIESKNMENMQQKVTVRIVMEISWENHKSCNENLC